MIFGNLDGSIQHQLIEPIYNFERVITNRLENGAQFLINKISFTEAASKLSMPLLIICFKTSSFGLVFTAYKTFPGKLFLKKRVDVFMDSGRMQYTG